MFNIGGPELFFILLVALIVLGPSKLPEAARQVGKAMTELRRISSGFQSELRNALEEPIDTTATSTRRGVMGRTTTESSATESSATEGLADATETTTAEETAEDPGAVTSPPADNQASESESGGQGAASPEGQAAAARALAAAERAATGARQAAQARLGGNGSSRAEPLVGPPDQTP